MKVIDMIQGAPPRTNGVTILMHNQIMFTQPPVKEDRQFMEQAVLWFREYQKGTGKNG